MMFRGSKKCVRTALACVLMMSVGVTQVAAAPAQVITPQELQAAVRHASQVREQQRAGIVAFLSTQQAERAMQMAKVDAGMVKNAVSELNQEELAQLSAKAAKAQADFAAGRLSDRDLLWVLVAIAALILVIVAVR